MSDEVKTGTFRSVNGDLSSKRISGFIILSVGMLYMVLLGAFSFRNPVGDPSTALSVGKGLIITGAGLLGVGVVERLGK